MATRPAKRQRRSTVILSDEEDTANEPSHLPLRPHDTDQRSGLDRPSNIKTLRTNKRYSSTSSKASSAKPSPTSSPQKGRKTSKPSLGAPNKSLHNFFNKATEEQRWQRRADTPQQESQEDSIADDIIDDESLDEFNTSSQNTTDRTTGTSATKLLVNNRLNGLRSSTPSSSQKFVRSATSPAPSSVVLNGIEQDREINILPWSDRYAPSSIEELAVHKKKIADVQRWLEDVGAGRSPQRVLVLKGPAGTGKSTTISLVAQTLGVQLLPWHNPTVSDSTSTSSIQQFADFLDRGGRFDALTFASTDSESLQQPKSSQQLLVVEEFPISMVRSSNVLEAFRSIILQHVTRTSKAPRSGNHGMTSDSCQPVVLLISETLLTSSTALNDSFTAHRLLGPEISNHPLVSVIEFNPVAPTFMSKAIDLVVKKEARESGRRRMPGPAVLQQLAEVGDIRSAINSLEFLCARGDSAADWSGTVASRSKKPTKSSVRLTDAEKNALKLINQRESTLDMFHAAGKIVYNKREDPRVLDNRAEPPPKPPDHLMHLYTPKISQVDVDLLLNDTGTDIQTFISTLHENYVLSCNGDDFADVLDDCSKFLSDSDFLNPESRSLIRAKGSKSMFSSNLQSSNFDMLRQDEISFQVACRGLLFSLPFPVNRAIPAGARKQDAFKIFYPASLRLWKPTEEVHDLVSLYATRMYDDDITSVINTGHVNGVTSWKSRSLGLGAVLNHNDVLQANESTPRCFVSRDELITEFLPYLTAIRGAQNEETSLLKKITQLRGVNLSGDQVVDDEQYDRAVSFSVTNSLQQRVEEAHNLLRTQKQSTVKLASVKGYPDHKTGNDEAVAIAHEKLYISDDDIQDD